MKHQNKKNKEGKLETKVLRFRPLSDKGGRFIPFCDYGYHQGYSKTPTICSSRECKHYYKLYIK